MISARRASPFRRSPNERIGTELGLSNGAMAARLDKMEHADLVRRLPDPDDRRGLVVELRDHGRELGEQSVAVQAEKESTVAATLDERERDQLNDLLRRLVTAFSDEFGSLTKRRA